MRPRLRTKVASPTAETSTAILQCKSSNPDVTTSPALEAVKAVLYFRHASMDPSQAGPDHTDHRAAPETEPGHLRSRRHTLSTITSRRGRAKRWSLSGEVRALRRLPGFQDPAFSTRGYLSSVLEPKTTPAAVSSPVVKLDDAAVMTL